MQLDYELISPPLACAEASWTEAIPQPGMCPDASNRSLHHLIIYSFDKPTPVRSGPVAALLVGRTFRLATVHSVSVRYG